MEVSLAITTDVMKDYYYGRWHLLIIDAIGHNNSRLTAEQEKQPMDVPSHGATT